MIQGLERTWSKRSVRGMTAMGVRFRPDARCAGILGSVESEQELDLFDQREMGYTREMLSIVQVEEVPFLGPHRDNDYDNFFATLNETLGYDDGLNSSGSFVSKEGQEVEIITTESMEVWVYVPEKQLPPTPDHPIAQSYVDTILRGCMAVGGEEFVSEFLEITVAINGTAQVWINDRKCPVYTRGDPSHSLKNAPVFDSLASKYIPENFFQRVESQCEETEQPLPESPEQQKQSEVRAAPPKNSQPAQRLSYKQHGLMRQ